MSARPISRSEFFASLRRGITALVQNILRSRVAQVSIALAVAAFSIALAKVCWQAREFLVGLLGVGVIYFGLLLAWELLPFSEQTRTRWARQRVLSERYVSYRWRKALWFGIAWAVMQVCDYYFDHHFSPTGFGTAMAYIVAGGVAHWLWHRRCRHEHLDNP